MTVNHDVTGSSPVGGATLRRLICGVFSFSEKIIIFILKMIYKYENIGWKRAEFLRTRLFYFYISKGENKMVFIRSPTGRCQEK